MSDQKTHKGGCFCGAVSVEVTGQPVAQGFCHCSDCRAWSAAPVTAYALFPAPAVKVTGGEDALGEHMGATGLRRVHCQKCGGSVMSNITQAGLIDLYPPVIPTFNFTPEAHVNYAERMIDIKDGLPKFVKMPDPETGLGEMLDE